MYAHGFRYAIYKDRMVSSYMIDTTGVFMIGSRSRTLWLPIKFQCIKISSLGTAGSVLRVFILQNNIW
jgi:hypothetical protein